METRNRTPKRTAVATIVAMLLSLVVALPAFAAEPTSSSRLLQGAEVLAGTQNAVYRVEVNYPNHSSQLDRLLDPKGTVDVVQIVPPSGILTSLEGDTDDWEWFRPANSHRLFFTGGALEPGSTQVFEFTADVGRPHQDIRRNLKVFLSDDGGANFTESSDDGLESAIRILKITSIGVTGPEGVTDGSATQDQDNVIVEVHLSNEGRALADGPTSVPVETVLQGAKNERRTTGSAPYGASTTFTFDDVSMPSSPGSITLTADSHSTDPNVPADAIDDLASLPLQIQRKLGLSYQSGSLSPQAVIPARIDGAPAYSFELDFDVTGEVDAALDLANTIFEINRGEADNSFSATLASPSSIANDAGTTTLAFEPAQVDMTDDEDYPVDVRVRGTDENDAVVDIIPNVNDTVDVDGLLPIIDPILNGDPSHLDEPEAGAEEVTTAGSTVDFGGTVEREDGVACTQCVIDDAFLRYSNGTTVDVTDEITLNNGQIGGSTEVTETAANATSVKLFVSAARTRSSGAVGSDPLVVDNVDPTFAGGITGQVPQVLEDAEHEYNPQRTITVEIAESVKFDPSTIASDWYVDNTSVIDADAYRDNGTATNGHADFVVLTVSSDLPDNDVPQVRYEPGKGTLLDGNRGADQVQRDLEDAIIDVIDGIVPDLPTLLEVNDRIEQDGAFWSNASAPSFTLSGIDVGDTVKLYHEREDGSLAPIGEAERDSNSDNVVINENGTYNFTGLAEDHDTATVLAEVVDPNDNSSGLAEFTIQFDFVPPIVSTWSKTGRDVAVTLSEPLTKDPDWVGRNFAADWAAEQGEGWLAETFAATSVSRNADDNGAGVLTVTFEQSSETASFDRLIYEFLTHFESGKRYEDRAGNTLADFTDPPSS